MDSKKDSGNSKLSLQFDDDDDDDDDDEKDVNSIHDSVYRSFMLYCVLCIR